MTPLDVVDVRMRTAETRHDGRADPRCHLVARLHQRTDHSPARAMPARPHDETVRDAMVAATRHLMRTGFRIVHGHTQGDEISVLLHPREHAFGRLRRQLVAVLAGEASAALTLALGRIAGMDCRLLELAGAGEVGDYFVWRQAVAEGAGLHAHVHWALRDAGHGPRAACREMLGLAPDALKALLRAHAGVDYDDLPAWRRNGVGVCEESYRTPVYSLMTGATRRESRWRLRVIAGLPQGDAYHRLVGALLRAASES